MGQLGFRIIGFAGVAAITPFSVSDDRGGLVKPYSYEEFRQHQMDFLPREETFLKSTKGRLRGVHFQIGGEKKMLTCLDGILWTVVVDVNKNRETLGKWCSVELHYGEALYVPDGYAIGTLAIENALFQVSYGMPYSPEHAHGFRWDDQDVGIQWPDTDDRFIGERDRQLPGFYECIKSLG